MKDLKPVDDIAIGALRRIIHLPSTETEHPEVKKMTKEEAIKILTYERDHDNFFSEYRNKVHDALSMAIEALSAQPEPKKGKWIRGDQDKLLGRAFCSVCNEWEYQTSNFNFCPNCGANMKE